MRNLRLFWRSVWDVREGELLRTLFMALYLLFVLFAYYILKPVSRALFLSKLDIDQLPVLYLLIAALGGTFAFVYTKVAFKTSLQTAVTAATGFTIACLVLIWWLLGMQLDWMLYVFNIWVSLFAIVLVSQGWLVAANVFDSREAKRLYGLLGLGAVIGAAFGGSFTAYTVKALDIEPRNLVLVSALLLVFAYLSYRMAIAQKGVSIAKARAAEAEEAEFAFSDIVQAISSYRHLQVIIGIMILTYVVDNMISYQFEAMAQQHYTDRESLTAFLGSFYGIYLNAVTFGLQFFLTALVVRRLGVGGTLQIMPVAIVSASLLAYIFPGLILASVARLTEASTRYTFNRTGMELLYMPLPAELKNRTKAFVDIFVDRLGRGLGAVILLLFTTLGGMEVRQVPLLVIIFAGAWIYLSVLASRQYTRTLRKRLESRRLDLASVRVRASDPYTVRLLEQITARDNPRQVTYAMDLLAEVPDYNLPALLSNLAGSPHDEIRAKAFDLARAARNPLLADRARTEMESGSAATASAVGYLLSVSTDARGFASALLAHPSPAVARAALESLPEAARTAITAEWLAEAAFSSHPERRALAALAIGVRGDRGTDSLHHLLDDSDQSVAAAACHAAGKLGNRAYLGTIISRLSTPRLRAVAIEALVAYGSRIAGTLGDLLRDDSSPVTIRRQIPRVLKLIPEQRSVDVLMESIDVQDLTVRSAVLKALNRLRESTPHLNYGEVPVTQQIFKEARYYYEMHAALAVFKTRTDRPAACLLARSLDERLKQTLERLFRLLGLRYPPQEIYSAYLAVYRRKEGEMSAALEFLDNVVDRDLKRVLLPLLDAPEQITGNGRDLFGVKFDGPEEAIRNLIHTGDQWLAACAMAAAAELSLRSLVPEIAGMAERAGDEVARVARSAVATLA
ncbi:MAG: Npt1/Npt2 family nucleotide transporter [Bryobacteraceae bacterium]